MVPAAALAADGQTTPAPDDTTTGTVIDALQTVMATEHAALWAYGLVAAYDPSASDLVADMVTSHQSLRDAAADLLVSAGATPVGPAAAYSTPEPVTDPASAMALALVIEGDCAAAWRAVIGRSDDSTTRGTALSALTNCAIRMVTWRRHADMAVLTVPFPGRQGD